MPSRPHPWSLGLSLLAAVALTGSLLPPGASASDRASCPPGLAAVLSVGGEVLCSHGDERPPAGEARQDAASPPPGPAVACVGDGRSGPRLQGLYVVPTDGEDRLASLQSVLWAAAAGADRLFAASALAHGGPELRLRWVHDARCHPSIEVVRVSPAALADFGATVQAVAEAGYSGADRKYLMWVESEAYCGVATLLPDDRPGPDNRNDSSTGYARIDRPCWGGAGRVEAHEIVHVLGGVQPSAPHATSFGHCTDEHDPVCYPDSPSWSGSEVCDRSGELRLDCGGDDYFDPSPLPGSYLDTHWNLARSRYLTPATSHSPPDPLLTGEAGLGLPGCAEGGGVCPVGTAFRPGGSRGSPPALRSG